MNKRDHDKIWELAAAKIHNEINSSEAAELDQLIQHADDEDIYNSVNEIHKKLDGARPLQESSIYRSWEKIAHYIKSKQIRFYLHISKYAAIILLAFAVGLFVNYKWKYAAKFSPAYTEIHVPLGQMSEMTMLDGTHIWLNSGTTLRYPNNFGKQIREVQLEGEAFFKVNKGETPFKVKIKNNEIKVFGTSFAAVAYPDDDFSQVTLMEGSVQVNDCTGRSLAKIKPSEQLYIPDNPKEKICKKNIVDILFYQSWIEGLIKFDEERLADIARRMERWYNVEINFTSEEVAKLRFTGTILKNKPIDQSIKAMSLLLPIETEYKNNLEYKDVITISKK
jgi:transmembrane sensor